MVRHEFVVVKRFVHYGAQHAADERRFAAWTGAQPELGEARQFSFALVNHDESGARLDRLFDWHGGDILLFGHIRADDQDGGRLLQLPNGVRGGAPAQDLAQRRGQLRAQVGRYVYIVAAHNRAREFLRHIVVFVRAARRDYDRVAVVAELLQATRGDVKRVGPGRLGERAVLTRQRLVEALARVVHEIQAELALKAHLPLVGARVYVSGRAYEAIALVNLHIHLAADRAMGADALDGFNRLVPFVLALNKRARGADVYARAAEFATRLQQRSPLRSADKHAVGALQQRQRAVPPNFVAHPHAARADYAQVHIHIPVGIACRKRDVAVVVAQRGFHIHFKKAHGVFEFAALVLGAGYASVVDGHMAQADVGWAAELDAVAGEAAVRMLGYEQIHNAAPQLNDVIGVGGNAHSRHNGGGAGRRAARQRAIVALAVGRLRLDHAHAAGAEWFHPRIVAQIRDVHSGVHSRLNDHLARLGFDLNAVYSQADFVCHSQLRVLCGGRLFAPPALAPRSAAL